MISKLTEYRFKLGRFSFLKDKDYLSFMKKKYPNQDLHHIMASSNVKYTDRLVVPVEHLFHLNSVHKNIPHYFDLFLPCAVGHYLNYLLEKKKIKEQVARYYRRHYTPEDLVNLFETLEMEKPE